MDTNANINHHPVDLIAWGEVDDASTNTTANHIKESLGNDRRFYKANDRPDMVIKDKSGNGNHGKMVNFPVPMHRKIDGKRWTREEMERLAARINEEYTPTTNHTKRNHG